MSCPTDYMNPTNYGLWATGIQSSCDSYIQSLSNTTNGLLNTLPGYVSVSTMGGIDQVNPSITSINANIATITADTAKRLTYANTLAVLPVNRNNYITSNAQSQQNTLATLRSSIDEKETLYTLRQGQASSLADKYAPAAYSSWWPLWFPVGDAKPLSDSTRTALYLFTGASVLYVASGAPGSRTRGPEDNQLGGSRASKIRR